MNSIVVSTRSVLWHVLASRRNAVNSINRWKPDSRLLQRAFQRLIENIAHVRSSYCLYIASKLGTVLLYKGGKRREEGEKRRKGKEEEKKEEKREEEEKRGKFETRYSVENTTKLEKKQKSIYKSKEETIVL